MTRLGQKSDALSRRALLRAAGLAGASGLVMLPPTAIGYLAPSSGTGFMGKAIDLATLQPVAGAQVQVDSLGAWTTTDPHGIYVLAIPPGTYTIRVSRSGFIGVIRVNQTVSASGYAPVDLDLVPEAPSTSQNDLLYQRIVKQTQAPLPNKEALTEQQLRVASLPSVIVVYYDQADPPYKQSVPLEDYVKGVVPNEVPPSWPAATLQAQAVAARSYGIASYLANGYVYPDTRSQVYDPTNRWPSTDAAVDATAGQVMTVNGSVIFAFFFSRCNGLSTRNSEDAIAYSGINADSQYICANGGWKYVSYCRARSCTGHSPSPLSDCGYYGHGVGMCQWGTYYRGSAGASHTDILNSYYTGITITGACGSGIASSATMGAAATSNTTGTYNYTVYLPVVVKSSCP